MKKTVLTAILTAASISAMARITPVDLRCEHCINPSCVDETTPRLSWINQPGKSDFGEKQTARRIAVSSSRELLEKGIYDLWDSGRVECDESNLIPYGGKALESTMDCWWKVMVWNKDGKPGSWSKTAHWGMGILEKDQWEALWIGSDWRHGAAPLFKKSINISKKIARAKVFVTARGFFELDINGRKVGDDFLVPGFTNYNERPNLRNGYIAIDDNFRDYRILYLSYDIKDMLKDGENKLSALLADGYYDPEMTFRKGELYEPFGKPAFLCQIYIDYEDGTSEIVVTDESWTLESSPITLAGIHPGEIYDARIDADGSNARPAFVIPGICGKFSAQTAPADKVVEKVKPLSVSKMGDGRYLVDFGRMMTGWVHFKNIRGNRGDTLKVICSIESPVGTQSYVFNGNGPEEYAPRFTWLTFRRVEISGIKNLDASQLWADFVHTDVPQSCKFECSTLLLQQIHDAYALTEQDCMHCCVGMDSPHRERNAYTGDGQCVSLANMHIFDCRAFYNKWLRDIRDCQNPETGYVPNACPWQPAGGGGIPWGAAMNIIPWEYYVQFNDRQLLERCYEEMKDQLRWMRTWENEDGLMIADVKTLHSPRGDEWLNLGEWSPACETFPTYPDTVLVHTFYMWQCAENTRKAAKALGKADDEAYYASVAQHIREGFNKTFYDPVKKSYGENGENIFALEMGVPEGCIEDVRATLRRQVKHDRKGHINCGTFGCRFLFDQLCLGDGAEIAYTAMAKTDKPSFGHWIIYGGTTFEEELGHNFAHCQPFFGSGVTWMYRRLAGVLADEEHPGYRHFTVHPYPIRNVGRVFYSNETPYGLVSSEVLNRNGAVELRVNVPVGCTATVYYPGNNQPYELAQGYHIIKK